MIETKVRAYRGIERADVVVDPIALIAGRNGSGKTSLTQAVGSVLASMALPLPGIRQGQAGVMVRSGHDAGAATVQSESGTARIDWPQCQRRTDETPPEASIYAAGLASVVDRDVDRVKVLSGYLHAAPTRDDLAAAIAETGLGSDEAVVARIWELIETRGGWDAAHEIRREHGAELKGRWRQLTGQNYGSRIAASWRPDLAEEERSEEELAGEVARLRERHEAAIASAAVSREQRQALEATAANIDERAATVTRARGILESAERLLATARDKRAACPSPEPGGGEVACPHCGGLVIVRLSHNLLEQAPKLEAARTTPLPAAEVKARRQAIAEAEGEVARYQGEVGTAGANLRSAEAALTAAQDARQRLETLPAVQSGGDANSAREALQRAEKHLADVRAKRQADEIRARIEGNDVLLGILAPDGLRRQKLARVIEAFNRSHLEPLTAAASWRRVVVEPDLEITMGGRHYALLSASEQFRVRVTLQVAMAELDGSAMVVIDGTDILDEPGRSDLFALLEAAEVPALVTMTAARRERVPDLAAAGMGASYWLEAGNLAPIATEAAAA